MNTRWARSTIRSALVLLAVAALAIAGVVTVVVARTAPAAADVSIAAVEDDGANCPVTLPGSLPANSRLPDPFKKIDGSRITSKADWRCRRAEIKRMEERYVYGEKPAKPASVTGTVSSTNITVNVSQNGRSASFSAGVQLPTGTGPFPAVVVLGGFGADTATIRSAGAAVINYDPLAVGREGTPRNNKQGAFYTIYGNTSTTGILAAWAWGVSRIIDVIESSGGSVLKADSVGVTGCSRYGKGALAVGAFDQRIALTMPIESGSAGAPIFRGIPGESGAQPLSSAYSEQPWLGDAFSSFTGNPNTLPVDQHETVAMIAPRGLFIMENPHIDWLAARSGSVAALGAAEVYKALGAGGNITYWSDISDGTHCATRSEWRTPLQQNIQKYLLRTGSSTGVFRISSRKPGNLAEWRDWTTPTLSDSPSDPPPDDPEDPDDPPPTDPPPTGGCAATVSVNQWTGGFTATVRVTAGSSAITGWTVSATLPSGATITSGWNANRSGNSGAVQFTNVGFNGAVGAGQSVEFGFQGTGTGTGMTPSCAAS
ncbi:cellulose binding domain-containing protein [Actinophytocola oryzae]|uniref:Cellulose binding domain-containing protein n=1 Tax=Actinophytocola oryzae TaxID=502181 RepID=A0A4R7W6N2_9PSEU|nr:cellulose binding domain-containing protein [Actinophytocola oryzae]TDV57347.1 cellulose binding domain-containing protein [Actinophytocola oryzae]